MRKLLVVGLTLFGLVLLISQLRLLKSGNTANSPAMAPSISRTDSPSDATAISGRDRRFNPFANRSVSPSSPVSDANAPTNFLVEWKGHWYPATILRSEGGRHFIHYTGSGDEWDEWVGPDRIRAAIDPPATASATEEQTPRMQPAVGDFVVKWGERWWRAEPLEQKDGKTLIRYVGYGAEWDEWVTPERAKVYSPADARAEAEKSLATNSFITPIENTAPAEPAAPFQVEWNGQWYPANVLKQENGKYFIHYEGYGDNWDEWVPIERLRAAAQPLK